MGGFHYDVIIVGAGTAGCVLANRLSEDPTLSILVLEAGEDRSDDERVSAPGLAGGVLDDPEFDWQYISQESGLDGREVKHPRGRVVGGTSAINSLALIYPSAAEIDHWAELGGEGAENWNWRALAPYFRKFQTIVPPSEEVRQELNLAHCDASIRPSNGPIEASFPLQATWMHKVWNETFRTLGLDNRTDPLEGHAVGGHTSTCHVTGGTHERSQAGTAYLEPALRRGNVKLVKDAVVEKLMIERRDDSLPAVKGVLYHQNGKPFEVIARKEVVLAAGTFNSPQLLELSGIGDAKLLKRHNIDVVVHNPAVGESLQDHIRPGLSFELSDDAPPRVDMPVEEARRLWEKDRSGPWAENICFNFAYVPLLPFLNSHERRELEAVLDEHLKSDQTASPTAQKRAALIRSEIESPTEATAMTFMSRRPMPGAPDAEYVTLSAMLSHPMSTGSSHIASADHRATPKIELNYYDHPLDLEIHARQVQVLRRIAKTEPLAGYIKPGGKQFPPMDGSVESGKAVCRGHSWSNYHPCGTCALGEVVDGRLRVKGVKGLRVVDASVLPMVTRGNIIATVYAVAERAADLIKEDFSSS